MGLIKSSIPVLAGLVISQSVLAEQELTAELEGVNVTFKMPDAIEAGTTQPVVVSVQPAEGQPAPSKIRARVGMPDHGHWISQQGFHAFTQDEIKFVGERCTEGNEAVVSDQAGVMCIDPWFDALYPMAGRYRVRVWLDYADGREAKAAIDLEIAEDKPLNARLVE